MLMLLLLLLWLLLLLLLLWLLLLLEVVVGTALGCTTSPFRRWSTAITAGTAGIGGCSHAAPRVSGRCLHRHVGCCPPGGETSPAHGARAGSKTASTRSVGRLLLARTLRWSQLPEPAALRCSAQPA